MSSTSSTFRAGSGMSSSSKASSISSATAGACTVSVKWSFYRRLGNRISPPIFSPDASDTAKPIPVPVAGFTAVAVLHLIIHGEDFILLILRNADRRIFNLEMQHIALVSAPARSPVPAGVNFTALLDQIPQNLAHEKRRNLVCSQSR